MERMEKEGKIATCGKGRAEAKKGPHVSSSQQEVLTPGKQYLKGGHKKEGDRVFSRVCCDRTRGNGFKLKKKKGRFRWNIWKKFFLQ